jgi:hypothetical protein
MNSSTSDSDGDAQAAADAGRSWRRWLAVFCGTFAGVGALLYTLLLLIDPYDTGRFSGFPIVGTGDRTLRTAAASHGRDLSFNAAVIGNSTGQLIDPYRLHRETGLRFTQLAMAGTGPREQMTVMRWVISRHPTYDALVIVTDPTWCTSDPDAPVAYPFPFWLYGSNLNYLANVLSPKALDRAVYRVRIALGLLQRADPVAYFDYLTAVHPVFVPEPAPPAQSADASQPLPRFPWIERLDAFLTTLSPNVQVVLVMPPVYFTNLPQPGTMDAIRIDACKAALAQAVATRPHGGFIDFRVDNELAHDATEFIDPIHYRHRFAHQIEAKIISLLRSSRSVATGADDTPLIAVTSGRSDRVP